CRMYYAADISSAQRRMTEHGGSTRRTEEQLRRWDRVFRWSIVASLLFHILLVLVFRQEQVIPEIQTSAAGEQAGEPNAAAGAGAGAEAGRGARAAARPRAGPGAGAGALAAARATGRRGRGPWFGDRSGYRNRHGSRRWRHGRGGRQPRQRTIAARHDPASR